MKGPVAPVPGRVRARSRCPTTCPGIKSGLKLDGPTLADIFSGKIKTWNDSGDQEPEPRAEPAEHRDHGRSPLGLLGHHRRLHDVPVGRRARPGSRRSAPARTSSGRSAPARPRTPASPRRSSRRRARSATSSRRTRSRTASRTRRSRTRPARTSCRRSPNTSAAADGIKVPRGPRDLDDQLAQPAGVPDRLADVPGRLQGPVQGRRRQLVGPPAALKKFLTYAFGAGQQTLGSGSSQLPYAPLPVLAGGQGQHAAGDDDLQRVADLVGHWA